MKRNIAVFLFLVTPAAAEPMQGPLSRVADPIAVRGGVLMVPLSAEQPGDAWPPTLEIKLDDGRIIEGVVAWVHPSPPRDPRRWTDDPRGLAVRRIEPADDTTGRVNATPFLLAMLPLDARGPIRLGSQILHPRWHDPARRAPGEVMRLVAAPDRPDPDSPFEFWRWVLLAERLHKSPPSSDGFGEVGALVAEHYAGLWRLALTRLDRRDADLAARCLDLLTWISADGPEPCAVWVADPGTLGPLLSLLLDFGLPDEQTVAAARVWADEQGLLVFRQPPRQPGGVTVAVASPGLAAAVVRFTWLGSTEVAASIVAGPNALVRAEIRRPPPRERGRRDQGLEQDLLKVLQIEASGRTRSLVFGPAALVAGPPGVQFSPLRPPLTLAGVGAGVQRPVDGDRVTLVGLRKLNGRWELFFECRRPPPGAAASARGNLAAAVGPLDTRGVEAVSVLLGPDRAFVLLTVPETGRPRLFRGRDDGTLAIHRRSYDDRWFCRIVLPQLWLSVRPGMAVVGVLRTHGDSEAMETGPYASLPWRIEPGRAAIDLTDWEDLPVKTEPEP